ncbi:hypothetical protein D1007_18924 [Hordeum vulgare]|nr:hypothetical protein D1007_18924 [Hordeum vulgare]
MRERPCREGSAPEALRGSRGQPQGTSGGHQHPQGNACPSRLRAGVVEQVAEHRHLEALQHEVAKARDAHTKLISEANTKLFAREEEARAAIYTKVAADRVALSCLDLRALLALGSICRLRLKSSLVSQDVGYAKVSSELVKELEGAIKKVDIIFEDECRDLFSVAANRVFSHLLLRDPCFEFAQVMGSVPEDSHDDLAIVIGGHMCMLLDKFSYDDDKEFGEEPPAMP